MGSSRASRIGRTVKAGIAVVIASLSLLQPGQAGANGYLFFHDHALDEDAGTVYLGSVTDVSGKPLADAQVSLDVMSFNQSLTMDTDARGRYRSTGLEKAIKPSDVKVSVIKPGYKLVKSVNLSRVPVAGKPIEINFILAKR
ncbi:hypothetical protein BH10PSE12_BH10PSE12_34320 [soil metagenome]